MIVIGGSEYGYVVDTDLCGHTTQDDHYCYHDWRIHWGNVDRQGAG